MHSKGYHLISHSYIWYIFSKTTSHEQKASNVLHTHTTNFQPDKNPATENQAQKKNISLTYALWVAIGFATLYVLAIGKNILIPMVFSVFIWYLINVLTSVFKRLRFGKKRTLPVPIAFTGALISIGAFLFFSVHIISTNLAEVIAMAPTYQRNLVRVIEQIFTNLPLEEPPTIRMLIREINFTAMATPLARGLTGFLGRGVIIIVYVLFLFLEQRSFGKKFIALANSDRQDEIKGMITRIDKDIRMYIGIKTSMSIITGILSYIILKFIELDFASFWAFTIFLLNFIPTVGSIVATIFPSLLALVQFENFQPFFVVIISITAIQQFIGNFLEPRLMGDRLNLSPLVILLSLALWSRLWGIAGMLFCVPITSIAMITLSHFQQCNCIAGLLSRN